MKSNIDFIHGKTDSALMKMVTPLFCAMVLMLAYGMVDSLWVGNLLGENGYAALTTAGAISVILYAIAVGTSNGMSIVVSNLVGSGDKKKADSAVSTALVLSSAFCLLLVAAMELLLPQMLNALGTHENIFEETCQYLLIFIPGYFFLFVYMQLTAFFRSYGDPAFQMLGMLLGTLLNAIIDPIFIKVDGIRGAAIATTLSEFICLILAGFYAARKKYFSFSVKYFDKAQAKQVAQKAVPSCIQQCMPAISSTVLVSIVNAFDVSVIASYGVIKNIENILFYPGMAMNMGLITIVGQCMGAGRSDRSRDYVKTACLYGGIIELVMTALVVLFAGQISNAFVQSRVVEEIVRRAFLIIGFGYVCYMLTNIFMAELSGSGKPTLSMILMFFYYIVIRVPLAIVLVRTTLGLDGMWIAMLVSHIAATILGFFILKKRRSILV